MSVKIRRSWSDRWLVCVLTLTILYGVALVVRGLAVSDLLFERLQFGFASNGVSDPQGIRYVRLVYSVVGAVLTGWCTTMLALVVGQPAHDRQRTQDRRALMATALGVGVWFILDSLASLAQGFGGHAAFNLVFMVSLLVPCWVGLRNTRRTMGSSRIEHE